MSTPSENQPHVVFPRDRVLGSVEIFPTYAAAFAHWRTHHHYSRPYVIHTLGRRCTPAAEIVDVNE